MEDGFNFEEDIELVGVPNDVALDLGEVQQGIVGNSKAGLVGPGICDN